MQEQRAKINFSIDGVTATGLECKTTQFLNEHSTIWPVWPNGWAVFWVLICMVHLTVCSCHVTYEFQSESTLYTRTQFFIDLKKQTSSNETEQEQINLLKYAWKLPKEL